MSARIIFRQRITKKTCVFSAQRAHWIVADFRKKTVNFGRKKKHCEKNKFISGDKKNIFPAMFFCLFFSTPSLTFFSNRSKVFFNSSPSLTFLEICPMFFYFVALINLSKNRLNVFFLECFFYRPPSLDFGFFLI